MLVLMIKSQSQMAYPARSMSSLKFIKSQTSELPKHRERLRLAASIYGKVRQAENEMRSLQYEIEMSVKIKKQHILEWKAKIEDLQKKISSYERKIKRDEKERDEIRVVTLAEVARLKESPHFLSEEKMEELLKLVRQLQAMQVRPLGTQIVLCLPLLRHFN